MSVIPPLPALGERLHDLTMAWKGKGGKGSWTSLMPPRTYLHDDTHATQIFTAKDEGVKNRNEELAERLEGAVQHEDDENEVNSEIADANIDEASVFVSHRVGARILRGNRK